MMEQTKIYTALRGVRGRKPVNLAALEGLLVRFSQLVLEQRWIAEIDINPLLASPERLIALGCQDRLARARRNSGAVAQGRDSSLSLRYVSNWTMKDGNVVTIRPIRPEDEPLMVKFHETLSDRSVYLRYFSSLSLSRRVAHERLLRICFGDYDREMVLVAEHTDAATGDRRIFGVGRMTNFTLAMKPKSPRWSPINIKNKGWDLSCFDASSTLLAMKSWPWPPRRCCRQLWHASRLPAPRISDCRG